MESRCSGLVPNEGSVTFRRCSRNATVERGGRPYCKIHDPVARNEKSRAKWEKFKKEQDAKVAVRVEQSRKIARYNDAVRLLLEWKRGWDNKTYVPCAETDAFLADEPTK